MHEGKNILGMIPARGGSKGLPRKNLIPLGGKPLIAWTIAQALASRLLDRVIVDTDDPEIAECARRCGAEVPFLRPAELARDETPIIDVIRHAIGHFESMSIAYDYVALLEPTSPLRASRDIDTAVATLVDGEREADSLVSVGRVQLEHPSIVKRINGKYVEPYIPSGKSAARRQDLDEAYFPYGVIYLSKTVTLLESGSFYQERTIPHFLERWQNYEVDDLYDLLCIEAVLGHRTAGGCGR